MKRNTSFLISAILLVTTLLTACAGQPQSSPQASQQTPTQASLEGQTVRVLLDAHPWQQAIQSHVQEFTDKTGIKVDITVLGEDTYWDRVTLGLSSQDPPFDVFMMSPNQTGFTGYQNNWIAPLDDYIKNAPASYNFNDIYPFVADGFRFPDTSGKLYGIPLTMETYMLFYRKDLFQQQGIDPANLKTMDDWLAALDKLQAAYKDQNIAAAVIRGQDPTMPDELLAAVHDYWGDRPYLPQRMFYFDKDWNAQFTDPAVVNGFKLWAKLLTYGPPGATSFTWNDCVHHFADGQAATYWFDASLFAGIFEDPNQSKVVGKVGYAAVPPTATGHGTTDWAWGLSMTQNSKVKDAAWQFIQWATSPEVEQITAPATYGPVRQSTWKSLAGKFGQEYVNAVDASLNISIPGYMYFPGSREVADRIIDAVVRISQGEDADKVMKELNDTAQKIVIDQGLKK